MSRTLALKQLSETEVSIASIMFKANRNMAEVHTIFNTTQSFVAVV
jgi:hypothetical protein